MTRTIISIVQPFGDRRYKAVWFEGGEMFEEEFDLYTPIYTDDGEGDYEWKYSVMEHSAEIFNLDVQETCYFKGCRDDKNSKGVIIRTK